MKNSISILSLTFILAFLVLYGNSIDETIDSKITTQATASKVPEEKLNFDNESIAINNTQTNLHTPFIGVGTKIK